MHETKVHFIAMVKCILWFIFRSNLHTAELENTLQNAQPKTYFFYQLLRSGFTDNKLERTFVLKGWMTLVRM